MSVSGLISITVTIVLMELCVQMVRIYMGTIPSVIGFDNGLGIARISGQNEENKVLTPRCAKVDPGST